MMLRMGLAELLRCLFHGIGGGKEIVPIGGSGLSGSNAADE
jgi:hypothetical protein